MKFGEWLRDVYSYGMVLWELATRELPYSDEIRNELVMMWISRGETEEIPEEYERAYPSYAKLIRWCWETEPTKRPTIDVAAEELDQIEVKEASAPDVTSGPIYDETLDSRMP